PAGARRSRDGRGLEYDAVDRHRLARVVELLGAERAEWVTQLVLDQLVDASRDVDRAWLGQRLQARCGIQAITRDVIAISEQLDETDPDAALHARLSGNKALPPVTPRPVSHAPRPAARRLSK